MGGTSLPSHKIVERWSNDGTYDVSKYAKIGKIKSITPNMEFSFELKIENMDSCEPHMNSMFSHCEVDYEGNWVLFGPAWFNFIIQKSTEASKYYICHWQDNGLGYHKDICKQNPITFKNNWQKEFLSKILMVFYFLQI